MLLMPKPPPLLQRFCGALLLEFQTIQFNIDYRGIFFFLFNINLAHFILFFLVINVCN